MEAIWPANPDWFRDRSSRWLRRAEEVRIIADTMRSFEMRQVLERIARDYEQLGELLSKQKDLALVRRGDASFPAPPRKNGSAL